MGTKLQELRDGCFHAAMDDEPMFVLLARDPAAPGLVRNWARQREDQIIRGSRPASDMGKVNEARQCADRMERWREANDGVWRTGMFADNTGQDQPQRGDTFTFDHDEPLDYRDVHITRREGDEIVCSCGVRYDAREEHP